MKFECQYVHGEASEAISCPWIFAACFELDKDLGLVGDLKFCPPSNLFSVHFDVVYHGLVFYSLALSKLLIFTLQTTNVIFGDEVYLWTPVVLMVLYHYPDRE